MATNEELQAQINDLKAQLAETASKAEELETGHLAQEHRTIHIWRNFFRKKELTQDQRRAADLTFFWNILPFNSNGNMLGVPIISIVTLLLAFYANRLLSEQNKKIDQQTYLLEADRRSSLVHLFSNVMDKVDAELADTTNNQQRSLTPQLQGRIIALSLAFKPYRYFEFETASITPLVSPERGHMLVSLYESDVDTTTMGPIVNKGNFEYADLKEANLKQGYFNKGRFSGAFLDSTLLQRANFTYTQLNKARITYSNCDSANFSHAELLNAVLSRVHVNYAIFNNAVFDNARLDSLTGHSAQFVNAYFRYATLNKSDLSSANFNRAKLIHANLQHSKFYSANFYNAALTGADLRHATFTRCKFNEATELDSALVAEAHWLDSLNVLKPEMRTILTEKYKTVPYPTQQCYLIIPK